MNSSEKPSTDAPIYRIRHSLAHLMAEAVMQMRPGTKLGFGPPIDDGFYYDFILSSPLTEEDFPEIEKKMRKLIQDNHPFQREDLTRQDALARIDQMGEPYKKEYAEELFEKKGIQTLSFYRTGPFLDMCEGPHVVSTRELPVQGFKLRSLAGAYWRGDSKRAMMTRIYAWAFETKAELEAQVKAYALAQERDHKKLGKQLAIFAIDETVGKGLPLWLPNGTVIRDELEKMMRELEFKGGYQRVVTPHLAKAELYYQTGHLPYYAEHMYPMMEVREKAGASDDKSHDVPSDVKEVYCLRPMNCPHHHKIFASQPRSYKSLPVRLAEYGQVYRFEDSGALSGILRVRGMCMNDAHIYCSQEQIKKEFLNVMNLHKEVYEILNIHSYYMRFSTWDPNDPKGQEKYVNNPKDWEWTQKIVYEAMVDSGLPFVDGKGEAAFYGPKIDFQFKTVTGREETASTNQLDFAVPPRLGLKYVGADNMEHCPYVIHRAPLGTHERFVAFLIEHFGGAFPTWLAPVQARVITVSEKFNEYAEKIVHRLRNHGDHMMRVELEYSSDTMGKKIRNGVKEKIPNLLIIGEREQLEGQVTLRKYGKEEQITMSVDAIEALLLNQIKTRSLN
jgi:threonyl-tRNA synthetase